MAMGDELSPPAEVERLRVTTSDWRRVCLPPGLCSLVGGDRTEESILNYQ